MLDSPTACRCHQPASWWQTVVTADVPLGPSCVKLRRHLRSGPVRIVRASTGSLRCWRNREPLVISPPTTTSKVRRRRCRAETVRAVLQSRSAVLCPVCNTWGFRDKIDGTGCSVVLQASMHRPTYTCLRLMQCRKSETTRKLV